ncbi:MAG: oligopeptide transporter, OPT family [Gemmataceae bacterium]|nr:oligopeptide transporter, OPT family [Gemmataceae bacterium]
MATENEPASAAHQPYVPDNVTMPEFTWSAVLVGVLLGILFGASSLYLVLKVGMTVSASVPIAVLSITLFRFFSRITGFRRATILENNIVQTTGSAGESIAFGVGVTMPALLLLGFEMDVIRVMTVAVLGGLLGILMMIPLRRAFIVKQHGLLTYPEGTACAEVLVAGEKGGSTARMVFVGFGVALAHKFLTAATKLWTETPSERLYTEAADAPKQGLKGAEIGGELSPELLGVGFLIGPKIASLMLAGAVLSYLVLGPLIATFGEQLTVAVAPEKEKTIGKMAPGEIKNNYLKYIGAGAVAAGGIISMCRALPLIFSSIFSGLRDLRSTSTGVQKATRRTDRDMSMAVVLFGSVGMVAALMFIPALGLGFGLYGLLGAVMILVFGFLFVTVSSRLTGEIGSSSNPISGMTIATLLLTCIIFLIAQQTGPAAMLTALTVAAVVCIASSNGGTTSQDLKTGYLIGATPRPQQYAILIGALTSALVIGGTMLALDAAGTHYTVHGFPKDVTLSIPDDAPSVHVGQPYEKKDTNTYRVVHVREEDLEKLKVDIKPGRYLVDGQGKPHYRTDMPIDQKSKKMDDGTSVKGFQAPQPQLFSSIIKGILGGTLEWGLFGIGALIAIAMELAGVRALPFAVGMYLPISVSIPIFIGGLLRWGADKLRGGSASDVETETSPGVLLSSGFIAGGTVCGLIIAFFTFLPYSFTRVIDFSHVLGASNVLQTDKAKIDEVKKAADEAKTKGEADEAIAEKAAQNAKTDEEKQKAFAEKAERIEEKQKAIDGIHGEYWLESGAGKILALLAFGVLCVFLFWQGMQTTPKDVVSPPPPTT